jgi:hypothetical protein
MCEGAARAEWLGNRNYFGGAKYLCRVRRTKPVTVLTRIPPRITMQIGPQVDLRNVCNTNHCPALSSYKLLSEIVRVSLGSALVRGCR